MGDAGSAHARFRRALATGNMFLIRTTAAELPSVDLGDALAVCVAIRDAEPERFERASLRWIARYAIEQAHTIEDVRRAVEAFVAMPQRPNDALVTLQALCGRR